MVSSFMVDYILLANMILGGKYHSLVKECPLTKEHPSPTFDPIFCIGWVKVYLNEHPPGASFMWSLRSTASRGLQI